MPTAAAGIGSELQPVRVRADQRRLARVFPNLLDKAARHAKSTIKIRMERRPAKRWSRWTTRRDHLPSRLRSVFERFARLDRGRLEAHSDRLALSISTACLCQRAAWTAASEHGGEAARCSSRRT